MICSPILECTAYTEMDEETVNTPECDVKEDSCGCKGECIPI